MPPIHEAMPALKAALAERNTAVLVAPPGAGKTTVAPLELLKEPWVAGRRLIVLEPRRLAARAAAARMAWTLGEQVGETVGFRVRMQSRVSSRTRIEVVTDGVFTRMIQDDPALEGVAGVLFDEFHERSLDADLGLALARDSQSVLRGDLRLLVMSATLDGARIASLLDDAPVVESRGRQYPVETRYLGRDPAASLDEQAARAVRKALAETRGGVLVFLPGHAEIRRAQQRLAEQSRDADVDVVPLYGALDIADQDRAIAPPPPGRRKVVLATSIAETSLTLEGVDAVVDCGMARVARYDPGRGMTRLETVRVAQAQADQRRGRAGRLGPGVCYRLWDEAETRSLPAFARPEILEADLSRLVLDLARWGAKDPNDLTFLDRPPAAAMAEAKRLLERLGALDGQGALSAHGRAIAELALPPRLAHMVLMGGCAGAAEAAARLAVLLTEQGLGGPGVDLHERLGRLARDSSPRARDARSLAGRWARGAGGNDGNGDKAADVGLLVAAAFPERVARARGGSGEFQLANGRGAYLAPTEALARRRWLAVAELGGGEARDRILSAVALDEADVLAAFADQIDTDECLEPSATGRMAVKRIRRLGRIVIDTREVDAPEPALIERGLLAQAKARGVGALPWSDSARRLRARVAFLRTIDGPAWPDLSDAALEAAIDDWLPPLLADRTRLEAIEPAELDMALRGLIGWDQLRRLDAEAPEAWTVPTGTRIIIDYSAEGGPRAEVRVQELFGLSAHPAIASGRFPLTLVLLSPARRPIQTTRDLPGFWRGSWAEVRKDMRGRYPKHPWPDDPASAAPTTRAKPKG